MAAPRNQYFLPLTRPLTMAVAFVLASGWETPHPAMRSFLNPVGVACL